MFPVLLVDDESLAIKYYSKFLEKHEIAVVGSRSYDEALDYAQNFPISVLITDLRLGDRSGVDLFNDIKLVRPMARGILISAYFAFEDKDPIITAGFDNWVQKPISDLKEFARTVQASVQLFTSWQDYLTTA